MITEDINTLEDLRYLQSEANKIDALEYFNIILKVLNPEKTFVDINGKPLPTAKQNIKNKQIKQRAQKYIVKIDLEVVKEAIYEPKKGVKKSKEYTALATFTYKKGAILDAILEEYLIGVKILLDMHISTVLQRRLEEFIKNQKKGKHTKFAIHGLNQFFGNNQQLSLFSDDKLDEFGKSTGLVFNNRPDSYGVVLNQTQKRVFEGILKAFTNTNYKGDEEQNISALTEVYEDTTISVNTLITGDNAPYKNIDTIPLVRLTQANIIELAGYDLKKQKQSDKQQVIEAINYLATTQFCFYWVRLKTDKEGKPLKDKKGDYIKEEVMEVGTLLRIKTIRDEAKILQYYEIHPSAPLLDQISNYFLLVPNNWREEVKQITGKTPSSYTYEFLIWLRLQFEQIRRYNNNGGKKRPLKPFKITKSWEDIAITLKMPPSVYKRNKAKAIKKIEEAYSIAIKLGYLIKVENNGATDILHLNESYYPTPNELTTKVSTKKLHS